MQNFATILKELRTELGLSQKALASKFNIAQQTVYAWEKNIQEPSMDMLIRLSKFFDVSTDYLMGLTDDAGLPNNATEYLSLSTDEKNILTIYNYLDDYTKEQVRAFLKSLYESQKFREGNSKKEKNYDSRNTK